MTNPLIDRMAGLVGELPALPVVAQQALALLGDPAAEPEALQTVLSRDPALAVKVLSQANSAHYCRGRAITTLGAAVVLLGFKTIQTLVLSSAVHRVLQGTGSRGQTLWLHSFGAGLAGREVARRGRGFGGEPEEAFLAGLFHDVGKGVLASKLPRLYDAPLGWAGEAQELGFHHGELGQALLLRWGIPAGLAEAAGEHHGPDVGGLVGVARVADWLIWPLAPGIGAPEPRRPEESLVALGLADDEIDELHARLTRALAEEGGGEA